MQGVDEPTRGTKILLIRSSFNKYCMKDVKVRETNGNSDSILLLVRIR